MYVVNPVCSGWKVGGDYLTMHSVISSSLHSKLGVLQHKAAFSRSATVSAAMQNIGEKFFHPLGRVSSIANNSAFSTCKVNNIPNLGASSGCNPMW